MFKMFNCQSGGTAIMTQRLKLKINIYIDKDDPRFCSKEACSLYHQGTCRMFGQLHFAEQEKKWARAYDCLTRATMT